MRILKIVAASTSMLISSHLFANEMCELSMQDIMDAAPKPKMEVVQEKSDSGIKQLAALPTTSGGDGATAGTLTNFVSLLTASGLGGSLFGDNVTGDEDNLSIEFNQKLGGAGAGILKFKAEFNRDPTIYEPLVEALPAVDRDTFRSSSEDQLDFGDDVTYSLSYSFGQGDYFGKRNIDSYERVFANIMNSVDVTNYQLAQGQLLGEIAAVQAMDPSITADRKIKNYQNISEATKLGLCAKAVAFREQVIALNDAEIDALGNAKFDKLISNSPQLLLDLAYNKKDILAGPDQVSAKLSFEWGLRTSIGAMERSAEGCEQRNTCAEEYKKYIDHNSDAIDASDRLKIAIEYIDIDDYDFQGQNGNFLLAKPGSEKFIASIGYGRALSPDTLAGARIDFELKHEDVEDDPDRNDRTVGTITLSKRLTKAEGWTMPFTIIYSNRPEFVQMATDDKFSAHIGIKWDMGAK